METMEIVEEAELEMVAQKVFTLLTQRHGDSAAVLALYGDLGAGKTAFVKAFARMLGVKEEVNSPTFVILKSYALAAGGAPFSQLSHIDAYRVDTVDEMRVLRFGELLALKDTIICIEWAEKIEALLPEHTLRMTMEITGPVRTITLT